MMRTLGESGNSLHLRWLFLLLSSFCFFARFRGSGVMLASARTAASAVATFLHLLVTQRTECSLVWNHDFWYDFAWTFVGDFLGITRGQTGSVLSRSHRHGFFGSYWPVDENLRFV